MKKIVNFFTLYWKKFTNLFKKKSMIEEMIELFERLLADDSVSEERKAEIRVMLERFKKQQQDLADSLDRILGR